MSAAHRNKIFTCLALLCITSNSYRLESVNIDRLTIAMPPFSVGQAKSAITAGFDILKEAGNLTSGRDPNYIRDAVPSNAIDAIGLAAARQGCRRYQQKGGDYSDGKAARAERACRPYLDSLQPNSGSEVELPFRGGQCPQVYILSLQRTNDNGTAPGSPSDRRTLGPILGTRREQLDSGTPPLYSLQVGSSSSLAATSICGSAANEGAGYRQFGTGRGQNLKILSVTPCGLNNCGNPPVEFTPPKAPTTPLPPGPSPFTRAPDIDVDIDVTINPDFSINIDIGTGPITIDPFAEPADPSGGGGGGGGVGGPGAPGDVGDAGSPVSGTPEVEAEGEAPPGFVLTGLKFDLIIAPPSPTQFTVGVYRAIGYIYMGTEFGLGQSWHGSMLRDGQFIFAEQDFLTHWRVVVNKGFNWLITPYYREVLVE